MSDSKSTIAGEVYYLRLRDVVHGPMALGELQELLAQHKFTPSHYLSFDGREWFPAAKIWDAIKLPMHLVRKPAAKTAAPIVAESPVVSPVKVTSSSSGTMAGDLTEPVARDNELLQIKWLSWGLLFAIICFVASSLYMLYVEALMLSDLDRATSGPLSKEAGERLLQRFLTGWFAQVGIFFVTASIFFVWGVRIKEGLANLGIQGLKFAPGWTIGWYFVPVANLWKPYQVMREIWEASLAKSANQWQHADAPPLVVAWWATWLTTKVATRATLLVINNPKSIDDVMNGVVLYGACDLLYVALGIVFFLMIFYISRNFQSTAVSTLH